MTPPCARCGVEESRTNFELPGHWIEYLVDEHDFDRSGDEPAIPLCHRCNGAVEFLADFEEVVTPDLERWNARVADRRNDFLDDVETTTVVDPDPQ